MNWSLVSAQSGKGRIGAKEGESMMDGTGTQREVYLIGLHVWNAVSSVTLYFMIRAYTFAAGP